MVGELHCLNCGRHLADVVGERGEVRVEPPSGQAGRPILVMVKGNAPHCSRCGGRALLERPITVDRRPRRIVSPVRAA